MLLAAPKAKVEGKATYFGGVDYVKAPLVGVPIIKNKQLTGYVVAKFVYTIEQKKAKSLSVPPDPFLVNAAFQRIYTEATADVDDIKKPKIKMLLENLRADVNERYGKPIVKEVLIERLNFLPIESVRAGTYETQALRKNVVKPANAGKSKSGHRQ